ncbi:MAG: winged helix-turn-helix domain-containing tetratricopeptide repeat protein [Pyrinomonadaceae bacterium]
MLIVILRFSIVSAGNLVYTQLSAIRLGLFDRVLSLSGKKFYSRPGGKSLPRPELFWHFLVASMDSPQSRLLEFGPFRLDPVRRLLWRESEAIPLKSKAFQTLLVLVENQGKVLEKDELMKSVWPDAIVEENTLNKNISSLRHALGESAGENRYIVTVPGRGYSFVAGVREINDAPENLLVATHTVSRIITHEKVTTEPMQTAALVTEASTPRPLPDAGGLVSAIQRHRRAAGVAVLVLLAAVGTVLYLRYGRNKSGFEPPLNSIAVLPLKQLGSGDTDAYLGLGMTDGLITKLGSLRQIQVRPTSAIIKYGNSNQDSVAAARELNVGAALEGSIQRAGDRVRVTVQLVSARDGTQLWAGKFDEKFTDIFSVEDAISDQLATALTLNLTGTERQNLAKHYTEDSEAFQLYLKGRYYWSKRTPDQIKKGIEFFEQAVKKDPKFALAYAGLADSYAISSSGLPPEKRFPLAKAAALKALELDDSLAEAHTSLALVQYKFDWDWAASEASFKRALDINPHYETARHWYGEMLALMGRFDEGLAELRRAQEMDPSSVATKADTGATLYRARRYDEAIGECRNAIEMDPNLWIPHRFLSWAYEQKGMQDQAVAEDLQMRNLTGTPAETVASSKTFMQPRAGSVIGERCSS